MRDFLYSVNSEQHNQICITYTKQRMVMTTLEDLLRHEVKEEQEQLYVKQ